MIAAAWPLASSPIWVVLNADPSVDIANTRKIHAVWHRGKKAAGTAETFTP